MNYKLILSVAFLFFWTIFWVNYYMRNYKTKPHKSYSVLGLYDDHKPILVNDEYLAAQSGVTLEEYYAQIAAYKKSRFEKLEQKKIKTDSGKNKNERTKKIDDNLGMSF